MGKGTRHQVWRPEFNPWEPTWLKQGANSWKLPFDLHTPAMGVPSQSHLCVGIHTIKMLLILGSDLWKWHFSALIYISLMISAHNLSYSLIADILPYHFSLYVCIWTVKCEFLPAPASMKASLGSKYKSLWRFPQSLESTSLPSGSDWLQVLWPHVMYFIFAFSGKQCPWQRFCVGYVLVAVSGPEWPCCDRLVVSCLVSLWVKLTVC